MWCPGRSFVRREFYFLLAPSSSFFLLAPNHLLIFILVLFLTSLTTVFLPPTSPFSDRRNLSFTCSYFKNSSWKCSRGVSTTLRKNNSVNKASILSTGEAQGPKNRQRSVLNHTALHRICNDCYKPPQASAKDATGGPPPNLLL